MSAPVFCFVTVSLLASAQGVHTAFVVLLVCFECTRISFCFNLFAWERTRCTYCMCRAGGLASFEFLLLMYAVRTYSTDVKSVHTYTQRRCCALCLSIFSPPVWINVLSFLHCTNRLMFVCSIRLCQLHEHPQGVGSLCDRRERKSRNEHIQMEDRLCMVEMYTCVNIIFSCVW